MIVKTSTQELTWAIYEALNNLDFALSNEEINQVEDEIFQYLKIKK